MSLERRRELRSLVAQETNVTIAWCLIQPFGTRKRSMDCTSPTRSSAKDPVDLVYAPGWFSNLEAVWDVPDLADFLGELASAFRLILLDRRGFGLSDWPITSGALSIELGIDDIRAVMDAAGSERAVLFGFDDGGAICTLFAASYPERVSALVLFAMWAKYYASSDYPWGWTTGEAEEWWQLIDRHWGTERFWEANSTAVDPAIRRDPERVKRGLATRACRPLQGLLWPSSGQGARRTFERCSRPCRSRHW